MNHHCDVFVDIVTQKLHFRQKKWERNQIIHIDFVIPLFLYSYSEEINCQPYSVHLLIHVRSLQVFERNLNDRLECQ